MHLHTWTAPIVGALLAVVLLGVPAQSQSNDTYVIRAWDDVIKTEDGTVTPAQVVVSYTPATHTFTEEVFDSNRVLLESRVIDYSVTPSPGEKDIARQIILTDSELGDLASRSDVRIDGGYILYDGACAQTRCLQFEIGEAGSARLYRFVVVDLNAGQILYRNFYPDLVD